MNITPNNPSIPTIATVVNPQADTLRRENQQREVITQPAPTSQSAAEKGVASERERARTPAQNNEQIDFAAIQEQAERESQTITENDDQPSQQQGEQQARGEASDGSEDSAEQESQNKAVEQQERAQELAEQQEIKSLQSRDREVRSHEQAHAAAGGVATGAPSYTFEVGPDGKKYAVEGEVSVDLSPVKGNPRATITKMQKVYNAALAPANPSIQDTRVANRAAQLIAQAQSELLSQQLNDVQESGPKAAANPVISPTDSFTELGSEARENNSSQDFDTLINQTLESQEAIAPSRDVEIDQRAQRIEQFYLNINQAYEKPSSSKFELTA